jgi:hypothetical protein
MVQSDEIRKAKVAFRCNQLTSGRPLPLGNYRTTRNLVLVRDGFTMVSNLSAQACKAAASSSA